jgi:hypothetical protein
LLQIEKTDDDDDDEIILNLPSDLNESQRKAICLSSSHSNDSTVDLVSGPPGSGKQKLCAHCLIIF